VAEGNCNIVTTCGATCSWGAPQTVCSPCGPGEPDVQQGGQCFHQPGEPDVRARVRTCQPSCNWGSWGSWICGLQP
jgi:hypothetical protein